VEMGGSFLLLLTWTCSPQRHSRRETFLRLALAPSLPKDTCGVKALPGRKDPRSADIGAPRLIAFHTAFQFTSDMLPSDVLGISIYSASNKI